MTSYKRAMAFSQHRSHLAIESYDCLPIGLANMVSPLHDKGTPPFVPVFVSMLAHN